MCKLNVEEGQSLLWDFSANGELQFAIYAVSNGCRRMAYPKLRLTSSKLPEEGVLENLKGALYEAEFQNTSTYFTVKVDYCIVAA